MRIKSVDDILAESLFLLSDEFEFTPSIFELKELREHVERVLPLYLRKPKIDCYSISSPHIESIVRFLFFNYEIVLDLVKFPEDRGYTLRLIAELKQKQADSHHG